MTTTRCRKRTTRSISCCLRRSAAVRPVAHAAACSTRGRALTRCGLRAGKSLHLEDLCQGKDAAAFCRDVFPERSVAEMASLQKWATWSQLQVWRPESSVGDLLYVPLDALKDYFGTELALYLCAAPTPRAHWPRPVA